MRYIHTKLEGVIILEPDIKGDDRGYFYEVLRKDELEAALGHKFDFVQENESSSGSCVIRGLHFQRAPHAQSKLIRVTRGAILDVAVDIRRGSATFGQYVAVELSDSNHRALFVPRGFAHGFAVLRGEARVVYKCDNYYAPEAEGSIRWNDPTIGIDWGIDTDSAVLSAKDMAAPTIEACKELFDNTIDYYA